MPRLFWPNFDFEHELAAGANWQPSRKLRELNVKFAPVLGALCGEEDVIVLPQKPVREAVDLGYLTFRFVEEKVVRESDDYSGSGWEVIPWGVTRSLEKLAESRGWTWNQPEIETTKILNDRLTSFEWERRSHTLPVGAKIIETERSLLIAIEELPTPQWIVKARFGMSGRERIFGEGPRFTKQQLSWIKKRLVEQGALVLEPYLENAGEASVLLQSDQEGGIDLLGSFPLLTAERGEYRGSRLSRRNVWQHLLKTLPKRLELLPLSNYLGPLGIDVMCYRTREGDIHYRTGMDINARWTMGRVAYEWWQVARDWMDRTDDGSEIEAAWLFGEPASRILTSSQPPGMQVIPTCCRAAGGVASALVIGEKLPPALFW